ncbi:MAG: TolC family protein [Deltaproteobacteria bacterium]|nr:TolC family protein [Deltaproteobacteria bacterium]
MHFLLTAIFLLILAPPAMAVTALSIEDAEKLFLENNLEIKTKKLNIQKAEADIVEARTLPNPALKYYTESLRNGETDQETIYALSQTVDLSGRRGRKIEAASANKEAGGFFLEQEIAGLLAHMKQLYCRVLLLKANEQALTDMARMFSEVEGKTEARVKAGDAAPADLLKLTAEKGKTVRGLAAVRTNLKAERRRLGLLLNNPDGETDVSGQLLFNPVALDREELLDFSLKNRSDLKGQERAVAASGSSLAAARKMWIPPIDLEAGYKKRTGGFEGWVAGISIPLPLFDRNQAGVSRAQAELEQSKVSLEALQKSVRQEVPLLVEQITSQQARIEDLNRQRETARELTKIAGLAYEEGETGLLELLEAVRTEKEFVLEYNQALYEHWSSILELEKVSGTKLIGKGGAQ